MELSDQELLAAVAHGDQAALRELFHRHARWLTVRLQRRCGDQGLVDETVVDTFERVWRKADTFRGDGQVGAWLWGIAIRRLIDRLRRRVPQPWPAESLSLRRAATVEVEVEDQVMVLLEGADLAAALDRLPADYRTVLQATVLDGLTTAEAADLLGIAPGTVKSRAFRARAALREDLS